MPIWVSQTILVFWELNHFAFAKKKKKHVDINKAKKIKTKMLKFYLQFWGTSLRQLETDMWIVLKESCQLIKWK